MGVINEHLQLVNEGKSFVFGWFGTSHRKCSIIQFVLQFHGSIKIVVLNTSQNSQENARVGVSSQKPRPVTLLKERLQHRCLPINIAKSLRKPFSWNISGDCFGIQLVIYTVTASEVQALWKKFLKNQQITTLVDKCLVSDCFLPLTILFFNFGRI